MFSHFRQAFIAPVLVAGAVVLASCSSSPGHATTTTGTVPGPSTTLSPSGVSAAKATFATLTATYTKALADLDVALKKDLSIPLTPTAPAVLQQAKTFINVLVQVKSQLLQTAWPAHAAAHVRALEEDLGNLTSDFIIVSKGQGPNVPNFQKTLLRDENAVSNSLKVVAVDLGLRKKV